jgi:hypothetical protein
MPRQQDHHLLIEIIDHAFNKGSWHGANLLGSLRGVDARLAARRIRNRKCIWEQALHAAYWKHVVVNRLIGTRPFPRAGSNWINLPANRSEKSWRADIGMLRTIHAQLRTALLSRKTALDPRSLKMVYGAAFHDVYHAGQIKLLRRMFQQK